MSYNICAKAQNIRASHSTLSIVEAIEYCKEVNVIFTHMAIQAINDEEQQSSFDFTRAAKNFSEKAQKSLLTLLEKHVTESSGKPFTLHMQHGLTIRNRFDNIAGNYKEADYEQIFALLVNDPGIKNTLGQVSESLNDFCDYAFNKKQREEKTDYPDSSYWKNYATYLAHEKINKDKQLRDKINTVITNIFANTYARGASFTTIDNFVRYMEAGYRVILENEILSDFKKNTNTVVPDLFGRYRSIDVFDLVLEDMASIKISCVEIANNDQKPSEPRKINFYLLESFSQKDVHNIIQKILPQKLPYRNFRYEYDEETENYAFLDNNDEKIMEYTVRDISITELEVLLDGYKNRIFLDVNDNPADIIAEKFHLSGRVDRAVHWKDSGRLLDAEGKELLAWRPPLEYDEHYTEHTLNMTL